MDNACRAGRRAFWDSVMIKYTEVKYLYGTWSSAENRLFLKKQEVLLRPAGPRKCYKLFPWVAVPPFQLFGSRIWLENSQTSTMCAHARSLSLLLAVQVCVVPLDSSFVFCSCSLIYAASESWSIWTTDHAQKKTYMIRMWYHGSPREITNLTCAIDPKLQC